MQLPLLSYRYTNEIIIVGRQILFPPAAICHTLWTAPR